MQQMTSDGSLSGRVAIVTGASSGIGVATAELLALHGAAVVLAARRSDRLEVLVAQLVTADRRAIAVPTDVASRAAAENLVGRALAEFGHVDILVNNAGIMPLSPVRELRVDEWDRMIDVNVRGVLYCIAAVLPTMLERGSGHIVNVGSVAGRRPFLSGTVYSATKFAVRAISAGLRAELSPGDNIRVSDIEPGVVATELAEHIADQDARAVFEKRWEGKRKLAASDIARAIHYVVSQPDHVNVNELLIRPTQQET